MSELKPCPFCGSHNVGEFKNHFPGEGEFYGVCCGNCDASTKSYPGFRTPEEAVAAWNRRAE
jgi:Lar family restriction alleviation protein